MDWGVSADNYGWAILGVVAPVVLTGLLLVRYRRATLGPESALAGMIMLAMLAALGARWLPGFSNPGRGPNWILAQQGEREPPDPRSSRGETFVAQSLANRIWFEDNRSPCRARMWRGSASRV